MSVEPLSLILVTVLAVALVAALAFSSFLLSRVHRLEAANAGLRKDSDERNERTVRQAVEDERARASDALAQAEQRHGRALEDQKNSSLSVVVHPFVNTDAQKGLFTRETKVEIGYKYQLFVQGLPCFEPHTMVLESTIHKEVDERMIELLKKKAEQAAEAAVLVKSGGAVKTAITIARAAIKLTR